MEENVTQTMNASKTEIFPSLCLMRGEEVDGIILHDTGDHAVLPGRRFGRVMQRISIQIMITQGADLLLGGAGSNHVDQVLDAGVVAVSNNLQQVLHKGAVVNRFLLGAPGRDLAALIGGFIEDAVAVVRPAL